MYAQLCKRLSKEAPNFDSPSSTCTFLRLLLNVCRDKFYNRTTQSDVVNHDGPLTQEEEERRHIAKQKMLGNVKFIGELSKLQMLSETHLHSVILHLLDGRQRPDSTIQDRCEDMECLNQLIRTCGKNLDTEQGKKLMDQYFEKMDSRSKSQKYPPRIRFMLRDLIELRNNNWVPRKVSTTEGPVPIRQIRTDDDSIIRPTFIGRREMRSNERDSDNWMNRFSLNLQPSYDVFNSLSVTSPSHSITSSYNNNRNHNQRNNQNAHNNYNNRYNKHNNNHNQHSLHNNSTYSSMMNNKDLAPRFKRNLITASQDTIENIQMRPSANSLLFKASVNMKTPTLLPITTPPPTMNLSTKNSYNSPSNSISNSYTNNNPIMRPFAPATTENTQKTTSTNLSSQLPAKTEQSVNGSVTSGTTPVNNIVNKETIVIKQSSNEKPAKQNKKDKGPNKDEVMKRVLAFLGEYLINENDASEEKNMDDVVAAFQELKVPDKFMKDACIIILNETIDKSEQQHDRAIEFFQQLRKLNKLSPNGLIEAFRQIVIRMNEKEITIPRITTLVASLLARAVSTKLCKLSDVAGYTENGQHYPLFLLVLQQIHKTLGKPALSELFKNSKIDLMVTLPEADRTKDRMAAILEDRNLSFLYPLLKVQAEMLKQITAESNPQSFYKWIKENVDSTYYTHTGFITALMNVLLKYITQETTLSEGTDPKKNPDKSVIEKEQALLKKYCSVLHAFLSGNNDLQLVALYALQVFCYSAKFPKGMLCRWFTNLYDLNVVEEDVFLKWKEEITDVYPGKGDALFQVNTWLVWLEQAESEDED